MAWLLTAPMPSAAALAVAAPPPCPSRLVVVVPPEVGVVRMPFEPPVAEAINVARFIDERPLSKFQLRTIILCALVVGLDGFDAQALGFVAPALSKDWHLQSGALGPVFGASLFGIEETKDIVL